jgi:DNA-binding response OmpR family regulator
MRVLVLEDEFLIAMDVEQICRDHGAEDVVTVRSLDGEAPDVKRFDAAIVDVMLGGVPTLDFAAGLAEAGVPFVFASGYTDRRDIATRFPDVALVSKPYSTAELIGALTRAAGRN